MAGQVRVEDFEVFRLFRGALLKFAQAADQALASADSHIARTRFWLESEQASHWQGQLRARMEAVAAARDAVRQKKLYKDSTGRTPSAVEEEKTLARCVAAVEQAHAKIEAVRKWLPRLEKANDLYRGGVSRLGAAVSADVPKAVALLDRLVASLEEYVQIEAPSATMAEASPASGGAVSVSRGAEAEAAPTDGNAQPPAATSPHGAAPANTDAPVTPESEEGHHVVNG
jgi:hypothetical protein